MMTDKTNIPSDLAAELEYRSPWAFVPSLYFTLGIVSYGLVGNLLNPMLIRLGYGDDLIGSLWLLGFLGVLGPVYAGYLDALAPKRTLSLGFLVTGAVASMMFAASLLLKPGEGQLIWFVGIYVFVIRTLAAPSQMMNDAYYIRALSPKLQAEFSGIQAGFRRLGYILGGLALVFLAGKVNAHSESKFLGWQTAYLVGAAVALVLALVNYVLVPHLRNDEPVKTESKLPVVDTLKHMLTQKRVCLIFAFMFMMSFGENLLGQLSGSFFMRGVEEGGMGCSTAATAAMKFVTDVIPMILGGVLGGFIVKWYGFRKAGIPLLLLYSLPNFVYVWFAIQQPMVWMFDFQGETYNGLLMVGSFIESGCYAMGVSAIMYYLFVRSTESGRDKTSVMAVFITFGGVAGILAPAVGGWVRETYGFAPVFALSGFVCLIGVALASSLPILNAEKMTDT